MKQLCLPHCMTKQGLLPEGCLLTTTWESAFYILHERLSIPPLRTDKLVFGEHTYMFQKSVKGFKPRTLSTYGSQISAFLGYTICVLSNLLPSASNQLFELRAPTLIAQKKKKKAEETCLCHSCDLYLNWHLKKSFKGLKLTMVSTHGTFSLTLSAVGPHQLLLEAFTVSFRSIQVKKGVLKGLNSKPLVELICH